MKNALMFIILLISFNSSLFAQAGYSSASIGMTKAKTVLPLPTEVMVEEYMNYHRHAFPLPGEGESVHLDLSWEWVSNCYGKEAILQVGLTTQSLSLTEIPPVNVSLVMDKSGSMSGERIAHTRKAAKAFIEGLRKQDRISVVLFDHQIEVLIPSQKVGNNKTALLKKIDQIRVGGSTDLNSGLIEGYDQVARNYKKGMANRVIMLTDALTNTGQVNPSAIVRNSTLYQQDFNIDISLIGVGINFNNNLSRQLTSSSKSSIHFINDAADIQKVFIDELESLMSPVAREVTLKIDYGNGLQLAKFYGYQPAIQNNQIQLNLNNMNNGLTQVFIHKFTPQAGSSTNEVAVSIEFYDIQLQKKRKLKKVIAAPGANDCKLPEATTSDVYKNYTIAQMGEMLKTASGLYHKGQQQQAQQMLDKGLQAAGNYADKTGKRDKDIQLMYELLDKYKQQLTASN